jgi:hypothetical protein
MFLKNKHNIPTKILESLPKARKNAYIISRKDSAYNATVVIDQ